GTATVKIISKSAGKGLLKAKMRNGNSRTEAIVFVADSSTAKIKTLELTQNKALANGQEKNIALTTVTDQFDNPVENFTLNARADNGATVVNATAQTDESGRMTTQFSSETAGDSKLVVEGAGTSKSVTAQFIADISTAKIQSVVITHDNATADGKAKNGVLVTVTDNRNNPLAGAPVTIKVPAPARYQTQPVSGMTDSRGQLQVDITNTKAAQENYTFSINDSSETRQLTFVADGGTATITDGQLVIVTDNQLADGVAANQVKATVVDQYNNRVPNMAVEFKTNHDAIPQLAQLTTDSNGEVVFDLTNTLTGATAVIAKVNSISATKNVMFTADSSTGEILSNNMTVVVDNSPANGTSQNQVKAIVTDAKGNLVPYASVTFTTDNGASPASLSLLTDEQGAVLFNLTNTLATPVSVTAQVNANQMTKSVTFVADSTNPDEQKSSLAANPATIIADGQTESTLLFTLKDKFGNLIPGQTVVFKSDLESTTLSSTTGNPDGTYTATLKGTKAGDAKISVTLNGKVFAVAPVTVKLTADGGNLSKDKSSLKAVPVTIVANNTAASALTLTLKDVNGNSVPGQSVEFSTVLAGTTFSTVTDNQDGTYTATLKGTNAGEAALKVTVNSAVLDVAAVSVTLTADGGNLSDDKSSLTAVPATIVANNTATSTLTLTLKDVNGNLVSGQAVLFSTTLANTTFSTVADNQDGTYTATLKGTKAGEAALKVTVNNAELGVAAVSVILTADDSNLSEAKSSLKAAPLTILADNTDTSTLTLTLKDVNDNPVSGQIALFSTTLADTTFSTVMDNQDGTYSATLKGTKAGDAQISVTLNGNTFAVAPVTVKLTADGGNLSEAKSSLAADPVTIVANNTATSTLTLTLKDMNGNLVSGQTALFSTALADTTISKVMDNQDGTYSATLKGTKAGDAIISVSLNGNAFAVAPVTVKLTADDGNLSKDKSSLNAVPDTIVADNTATSELTLTLKDVNGNPVPGQIVLFSTMLADTTFSTVTDNQDGTYGATLKGTKAGDAALKVTVNGTELAVAAVSVTLTADDGNLSGEKSSLTAVPDTIVADDTETSALTLTLKDVNGNLVAGQTVLFSTTLADTTFSPVKDNQNGTYSATLKGTKSGDAVLKVTVNGADLAVAAVSVTLNGDGGNLSEEKSSLTAVPDTIVANNTETSALTLTLKDVNGNPVTDQTVLFSTDLADTSFGTVINNQDGTYTTTLKGTKAGEAKISVTLNGNAFAVAPVTVNLTADDSNLSGDKSSLTAVPDSILADNTETSTLTLTLKDVNGNLVSGQIVLFSTTLADVTFSTVKDNQNGTYTATLKGTKAGEAALKVTVSGTELAVAAVSVTLNGDGNNLSEEKSLLAVAPDTIVANDTETSVLTLTLKDVNGNAVTGQTVLFSTELVNTTFSTVTGNPDGTYTATLKGTKAGNAEIKVSVNSAAFNVTPKTVKLVADKTTAVMVITNLNQDKHAVADTVSANGLEVKIVDANNNPIDGVNIKVTEKTPSGMVTIVNGEVITNINGIVEPKVMSRIKNVELSVSAKDAGGINISEDYSLIFDLVKFKIGSVIEAN
ncbi:beta strand repeat-containing protein, partial [Morganella psychrotolerans]|uniref:beta strand repeat-containing protein n=1 Tax=Morganella psychrotolerans TaxID=368603 RepID=UPI000A6915BF